MIKSFELPNGQESVDRDPTNIEAVLDRAGEKETIREKIRVLQLTYLQNLADKKYKDLPYDVPEGDFVELFSQGYAHDAHHLNGIRLNLNEEHEARNMSEEEFREYFFRNIDEEYKKGGILGVESYLDSIYGTNESEDGWRKNKIGFIKHSDIGFYSDSSVEIHVADKGQENVSAAGLNKSLQFLAQRIIDQDRYVGKIKAKSWLMDFGALRKRLGFHKKEEKKYELMDRKQSSPAIWGQFINFKGELKKKEVKQMLETGIPPHNIVQAEISIEDFLYKHLPETRGQEFTFYKESEKYKEMVRKHEVFFKDNKESLIEVYKNGSPEDVLNIFKKDVIWREVLSDDGPHYSMFHSILEEMQSAGDSLDILDNEYPDLRESMTKESRKVYAKLRNLDREEVVVRVPNNKN
jgi:hypothetical protein